MKNIFITGLPFFWRVCGRSLAGNAGSISADGMNVCCVCCVFSGTGPCDGPIPHPA
jgi:hypothetical protein